MVDESKKVRVCIDCSRDISSRGNQAYRCKECQKEYRKNYLYEWRNNQDKGFFGITNQERETLTSVGNTYDDYRFLEYKHKLDKMDNGNDRNELISQYKPLDIEEFKTNNEVLCLQYKKIIVSTDEEQEEELFKEYESSDEEE